MHSTQKLFLCLFLLSTLSACGGGSENTETADETTTDNTGVQSTLSTPVPSAATTPEPTVTATPALSITATPVPASTTASTPIPTASPAPAVTSTPEPAATPIPTPRATATPASTAPPTPVPTATPAPTAPPTPAPTASPTPIPTATPSPENTFASKATLGQQVFTDPRFSFNRTQSCATCHSPTQGFIDDRNNGVAAAVSLGDDGFSLGDRNSPTVTYAALAPTFTGNDENARGGQFLDGRAVDLHAQAGEPFLNPLEMNMPDRVSVVARMLEAPEYIAAFRAFYGANVFDNTDSAFLALSDSLAEFQRTPAVSPFDSKYDRALAGSYNMTNPEVQGMNLFFSNQASCLECHHVDGLPNRSASELFTSHRYFNIGTPANQTLNNHLSSIGQQANLVANGDQGLFNNPAVNNDQQTRGLFKVPTLRNIAVTAPYMHNGTFANLETVLHFYDHQGDNRGGGNGGNRRPLNPETGLPWANPEVNANIDNNRLRMPGLNNNEVDALECFLRALTDAQFESKLPPLRPGLNCS